MLNYVHVQALYPYLYHFTNCKVDDVRCTLHGPRRSRGHVLKRNGGVRLCRGGFNLVAG